MTLLTLLACLAKYEPGVAWAPHHEPLPPALSDVFANQNPDDVFKEAVARHQSGDPEGAIQRLVWLNRQHPGDMAVLFQLGLAYELASRFEDAVSVYDHMQDLDSDGQWVLDWGYRRATCLQDLGRHDEALSELRALPRPAQPGALAEVELSEAIAAFQAGRGSEKHLVQAIEAATPYDATSWTRGRAHIAIVDAKMREAATYTFDERDKKQARHLKKRATLLLDADPHVAAALRLEQVHWAMTGLLLLGDGYAQLAEDLRNSRPPRGVDPEVFYELLDERALVLEAKAHNAYDQGASLAGRFLVDTPLTEVLLARRDALQL